LEGRYEVGGWREVERGLRAFLLAGHKKEPKEQNDNFLVIRVRFKNLQREFNCGTDS
jgi:hypothetical protein